MLIATLFTDSVIRLSRELDRFEIPYIYVDSNIEGQHQLAYFGTESYDAGVIAARLLTDRISPASDILMARIIHSGKNDSNQGRNRREGFCRYLKEMRCTGSLHAVSYTHLTHEVIKRTIKLIIKYLPQRQQTYTCY